MKNIFGWEATSSRLSKQTRLHSAWDIPDWSKERTRKKKKNKKAKQKQGNWQPTEAEFSEKKMQQDLCGSE